MTIAGVVDLIIVFVVSKYSITGNTLILICLPVVIGIMYLAGAFYNEKLIKNNSNISDNRNDVGHNGVEGDGDD